MGRETELRMIVEIERMLAQAKKAYDDAARFHAMGKVNFEAGRRAAFEAVLKLIEAA